MSEDAGKPRSSGRGAVTTNTTKQLPASLLYLDKPSLHGLAYVLRHPDTWPEGFIWDYKDCHTCAMGLAHQLWQSIPAVGREQGPSVMATKFSIGYEAAQRIFMGHGDWVPEKGWWLFAKKNLRLVTPEMVAEQIEVYLESVE